MCSKVIFDVTYSDKVWTRRQIPQSIKVSSFEASVFAENNLFQYSHVK